ncbi:hypothetical protein [Ensifer adhaerens]|uniref:hypothetical protein n=1 Tax=Ensifer adhaerens TaxID=106592 RepID=UPI000B009D48|nr:hypothetical protein [Ensifer adhaerens]
MAAGKAGLLGQRQEEAEEGFIFAAAEAPETLQAPKLADFLHGATGQRAVFKGRFQSLFGHVGNADVQPCCHLCRGYRGNEKGTAS